MVGENRNCITAKLVARTPPQRAAEARSVLRNSRIRSGITGMINPMPIASITKVIMGGKTGFQVASILPGSVWDRLGVRNGDVLMLAWMNAESLQMTLVEGRMVYWSRSRQELWRKGDTSGDRQFVREAYYDCDADALLFKVEQEGAGACHTGERTCFFRSFGHA